MHVRNRDLLYSAEGLRGAPGREPPRSQDNGAVCPLIAGDLSHPHVHPAPFSYLAPLSCTWPDMVAQQPPVSEPSSSACCSCRNSPVAPCITGRRQLWLLLGALWVRCSLQSNQLCVQDREYREGPLSHVHWGNGSEHNKNPCSSRPVSRPTARAAACAERSPQGVAAPQPKPICIP